ncbi:hypothetical protein [Sphingomonas sp. PB1R3]|uniref:hypothetical protein n=1 Tax=Sphingomonas flavida TaxID=3096154 RepID=UPI002FCC55EC
MMLLLIALQAATAAAPAPAPAPVAPQDKVICKTYHETGSFLKTRKTCLTRQQWQRSSETNQGAARNVVSAGTGVPDGNLGTGGL